jgi:hypothetical protein
MTYNWIGLCYALSFRAMCHYLTDLSPSTCATCTDGLEIVGTIQYAVFRVQKLFLKTGLRKIMDGLLSKYEMEASINIHVIHQALIIHDLTLITYRYFNYISVMMHII